MSKMMLDEYEFYGEEFSRQIGLYRQDLHNRAESAALRLEQAKVSWSEMCRRSPPGVSPPSDDFYLMFAFMMAVDVGRADEAERIYGMVSLDVRSELDAAEELNPGQFKIWLTGR